MTKETRYGKLLDEFISRERKKMQAGSGDDMFYEQQIVDYIKPQRAFWITFIKFIESKHRSKRLKNET